MGRATSVVELSENSIRFRTRAGFDSNATRQDFQPKFWFAFNVGNCLAGVPSYVIPGAVWVDLSRPLRDLRTDRDDPPAYDDPSKFGGG